MTHRMAKYTERSSVKNKKPKTNRISSIKGPAWQALILGFTFHVAFLYSPWSITSGIVAQLLRGFLEEG